MNGTRRTGVIAVTLAILLAASVAVAVRAADPAATQQSPAPGPSGDLEAALALAELMNLVPAGIMETCQPGSAVAQGLRASADCSIGDDGASYASFDDLSSLEAAYLDTVAQLTPEAGASSCREGPFEGPYLGADGSDAGRVVCQEFTDTLMLFWTDDRNLVYGGVIMRREGSFAELHDLWLRARMDAVPAGGASPSPAGASAHPVQQGTKIRQWAASATASTEYQPDVSSASQASGSPDTTSYGDDITAWAPAEEDGGIEWIELTYARSVVPTGINIWESSGAGFVTQVDAWDDATHAWRTLWQGNDPTPREVAAFSPPLAATDLATQFIRVTIDTRVPGWNEIDAVELIGVAASP